MESNFVVIIGGYLVALNVITFLVYGFDKAKARSHTRRTPEKVLWMLALAGGSIGALLAMNFFRHKTQKLSFQLVLFLIILAQAAILYGVYWLFGGSLSLIETGIVL